MSSASPRHRHRVPRHRVLKAVAVSVATVLVHRTDGRVAKVRVRLDRRGNEVVRWNFFNAWPSKYDAPDFNAEGNDVAIETMELAHEGLERVK